MNVGWIRWMLKYVGGYIWEEKKSLPQISSTPRKQAHNKSRLTQRIQDVMFQAAIISFIVIIKKIYLVK